MIPKLHKKGTSFKGAAAYLLHDKDKATTAERVDWVHTVNLATDNPQVAWRVMSATSMDADRLKEQAGVKTTGRKSKQHVMHYSLSWHPEETLTRDEMLAAAESSLSVLGANDRQAMIIAHNDEAHHHVHILVNRVSDQDGRLLSTSNEKRKLSHWAENYEKERGKIYCEERVLNNAARKRGELVNSVKDQPRHIVDMEKMAQEAANDNGEKLEALRATQRTRDALLSQQGRDMQTRHEKAKDTLYTRYKAGIQAANEKAAKDAAKAKSKIHELFKPRWREQFDLHQEEQREFEANEKSLLGKTRNIFKSLQSRDTQTREMFGILTSVGKRRAYMDKLHRDDAAELQKQQNTWLDKRMAALHDQQQAKTMADRKAHLDKLSALKEQKETDTKAMQEQWRTRNQERQQAFDAFKRQEWEIAQAKRDMAKAASPALVSTQSEDTRPIDLPKEFKAAAQPAQERQSSGEDTRKAQADKLAEHRAKRDAQRSRRSRGRDKDQDHDR